MEINAIISLTSTRHATSKKFDHFYADISNYIRADRENASHGTNQQMIHTYALIGKRIIEEDEQKPTNSDHTLNHLLKDLARKLNKEFGSGFSFPQLRVFRKFYLSYKNRINLEPDHQNSKSPLHPSLTWTHYRMIMQLPNDEQKIFYEQETIKHNWSTSQLQRQILFKYYERSISTTS